MKLTKTLLILLFSFCFLGVANAEVLTWSSFFFPKLEKYEECYDKLREQNVDNYYELCADKYAKAIDKYLIEMGGKASKNGRVTLTIENKSSIYSVEKINIKGYFYCENTTRCEKQYFSSTTYPTVSPNDSKVDIVYLDDISIPESVIKGDWGWSLTLKEYFGFKVDY